jgi:hypothetical protein
MPVARKLESPSEPAVIDVVGKSATVFLAPLIPASVEPFMNENLEREPAVETELDIKSKEVEVNMNSSYIPDDGELDAYRSNSMDLTNNLSQGLTYEQISHAVEVVEGRKSGESDEYFAGETLCIMPDDFLNVICMQANHEAMVKRLITGYLDFPGKMKPVPLQVANFDINKYV